jgi:anti-anti-sigma factor
LLIDTRRFADATVAAPQGRIDHLSAAEFEAALTPLLAEAALHKGAVVLDFSEVEYISSVGLRALMIGSRQAKAGDALLVLAALRSVVAEIFTISRFDKVLSIEASLDAALARCSPAAQAAYRAAR